MYEMPTTFYLCLCVNAPLRLPIPMRLSTRNFAVHTNWRSRPNTAHFYRTKSIFVENINFLPSFLSLLFISSKNSLVQCAQDKPWILTGAESFSKNVNGSHTKYQPTQPIRLSWTYFTVARFPLQFFCCTVFLFVSESRVVLLLCLKNSGVCEHFLIGPRMWKFILLEAKLRTVGKAFW